MVSRLMDLEDLCRIFDIDPKDTEGLVIACEAGGAALVTQYRRIDAPEGKRIAKFHLIEADDE